MAEILAQFDDVLFLEDGVRYHAHACGAPTNDGGWHGWLEFVPLAGGDAVRSGRETTQPNRTRAVYWARGLSPIYLEGALHRALTPLTVHRIAKDTPVFEEPAPEMNTIVTSPFAPEAALDPFAFYERHGEELLRRQLSALATRHLVNILSAYRLTTEPKSRLDSLSSVSLIERIVNAVRDGRSRTQSRRSC